MRLSHLLLASAAHQRWHPRGVLLLSEAEEELCPYAVALRKPLGIRFEEREDGRGLEVGEVLAEGSAAADGRVWPCDLLLSVGGRDCGALGFDDAMQALIDADALVELEFGRVRGRTAALRFPDGPAADFLVFARPGDALMPLARRAQCPVEYDCLEGSCGVCDMVLRDGETEEMKPVRFCRARIPRGAKASLMPWDVLRPESPEAQAFYARMESKLRRRLNNGGPRMRISATPPPRSRAPRARRRDGDWTVAEARRTARRFSWA